jgi:hypothetical protein
MSGGPPVVGRKEIGHNVNIVIAKAKARAIQRAIKTMLAIKAVLDSHVEQQSNSSIKMPE